MPKKDFMDRNFSKYDTIVDFENIECENCGNTMAKYPDGRIMCEKCYNTIEK